MRSSTRTRMRGGALSASTATALAAALVAVPVAAAHGGTAAASVGSPTSAGRSTPPTGRPTVVTLLTGDRVLLRQGPSGKPVASLTPRSPHYGKPVEFVTAGSHTWVVPRLAPTVRKRFDPSVFDVAALTRAGRVSLRVTFAHGVPARALPGLAVRTAAARSDGRGRTTATASYDVSRPLPSSLVSSLRGVFRIAVAGSTTRSPAAAEPAYQLHTLTINGTTARGRPIPVSDVFVVNADDGRLFDTFGGIIDGQWKVSVPSGTYFVVVSDFTHVVVRQITVGDADTLADLSLAEASVKPTMTAPKGSGLRAISPALDILGTDQPRHAFFGFSWSGIFPKVSPLAPVQVGTLHSQVADMWTTKGYQPVTFHGNQVELHPIKRVAAAKEVGNGIPRHLTFHYRQRDFAHVAIKHYATGPRQTSMDSWFGWTPIDAGAFVDVFPTVRPGVVHAMFLARRTIHWDSSTAVSDDFRSLSQLDQTERYHRGQRAVVPFFRGPVTPVADRGGESRLVGFGCQLCVQGGFLGGFLSMFSGAGTTQVGITDHGRYALFRGGRRLDHGGQFLAPFVKGVEPGQHLRLVASTTPQATKYVLSRNVRDTWRFRVPHRRRAVVPILRAAYVPPTDLHSIGRSGRVSYPITFDTLGPVDARVSRARVQWSVDGRHWRDADLTRRDKNTFRVSYRNPAGTRAHPYLNLRATAKDTIGGSISESVEHAYVLPHQRAGSADAPTRHRERFRPGSLCRTSVRLPYSCFVELGAATRSAGKASPDPAGWGAPALRSAYGLGDDVGQPDTVAVVVAFHYPHAESDMNHYRAQYGLPACTSASGCFRKINQNGEQGHYPERDYGWGVEASLDLQMISAACPTCHIVLVEADEPADRPFFKAERAAVDAGATVTNHSFGRIELTGAETDALNFVHPGVTAVASTGDAGYGPASFPADSPDVVAVGGTVLSRTAGTARGWSERAWQYAGSGCSAYFDKPAGQADPACRGRTEADLSAVARGLAIYNTSLPRRFRGWMTVDGTSASSPFVAGMIGSTGGSGVRPSDLYAAAQADPGLVNDATGGSNGFCRGSYLCTGRAGYDGPTGLGSPNGTTLFDPVP